MANPRLKQYTDKLHSYAKKLSAINEKDLKAEQQKFFAQYAILIMREAKEWLIKPFPKEWLTGYLLILSSYELRSQESYREKLELLGEKALALFKSDISDIELLKSKEIQAILNDPTLRAQFCNSGYPRADLNGKTPAEQWVEDYAQLNECWKNSLAERPEKRATLEMQRLFASKKTTLQRLPEPIQQFVKKHQIHINELWDDVFDYLTYKEINELLLGLGNLLKDGRFNPLQRQELHYIVSPILQAAIVKALAKEPQEVMTPMLK